MAIRPAASFVSMPPRPTADRDPQRGANAGDMQAVRPVPFGDHFTYRVVKLGNILETARHRLDAIRRERQPVEQGLAEPLAAASRDISFVGQKNIRETPANVGGGLAQRLVLGVRRCFRQHLSGGARGRADVVHQLARAMEPATRSNGIGDQRVHWLLSRSSARSSR